MNPAVAIVVLVVVALVGVGAVASYQRFVRQRTLVQESWRQVDVELTRRHDLIPTLVNTVKGYAAHEAATFDALSAARTAASRRGASPAAQAVQESALQGALGGLLAVVEAYPNLKADQQFLALQQQLIETEDRIATGQRFYNVNVRALNTQVEAFPSCLMAGLGHFVAAEYFETEDPAVRGPVSTG